MSNSEYDVFKLCLVGDDYVGKSCLLGYREDYIGTMGQEIHWKSISINNDGKITKLRIWDYEGWHKFHRSSMPNTPYPVSFDGIVLVFDLTNHASFLHLQKMLGYSMHDILLRCSMYDMIQNTTEIILVGTKSDLDKERAVTDEEIVTYADSLGCKYIETSAKNQVNVEEAFSTLARQIAEKKGLSIVQNGHKISDLLPSTGLSFFPPLEVMKMDDETAVSPKKQLSDNTLPTIRSCSCVLL